MLFQHRQNIAVNTDQSLQKDILASLEDIKKGDFIAFSSSKEMLKKIS
jgi:hypothetical protein